MLLFEETISHGKTTPKLIRKKCNMLNYAFNIKRALVVAISSIKEIFYSKRFCISLFTFKKLLLKEIYLSKALTCMKFFLYKQKLLFIKETDTFGHIVV